MTGPAKHLAQPCRNEFGHGKLPEAMPAQPSWFVRIPEMLECLRKPSSPPFLDRPAVERLFGVGRRQAIRLMGGCSGYQIGKTFLVDTRAVIEFLSVIETSGAGEQARVRKNRVAAALEDGAGRVAARQILVPRRGVGPNPGGLPAGIAVLGPGRVEIRYQSAEDLLARVVELVSAATRDFPAFRSLYEEGS